MSDLPADRARKVAQNKAERAADEERNIDQAEGARAKSAANTAVSAVDKAGQDDEPIQPDVD
jgi:hypothetical protein